MDALYFFYFLLAILSIGVLWMIFDTIKLVRWHREWKKNRDQYFDPNKS